MSHRIPFNRPFVVGKELAHIARAIENGHIGADGEYAKRCARLMEERFGIAKVLLTPSCTAALEMAAMLCELQPGDEVIMPSYTFPSTATSIVRLGARPRFVDIRADTLNMDAALIEAAVTPRTKAIACVHYAGTACDMDAIMDVAKRHGLRVIEDAAQGVHAYHQGRALGSIGDLGAYSFHETKNYICGEGGALCINDPALVARAEIIRDKGTDRQRFFRGEVDKYTWVDIGSSYVPSELSAAFLWGQLEHLEDIAARRKAMHERYRALLAPLQERQLLRLPHTPSDRTSNHHMFYVIATSAEQCKGLATHLEARGIQAVQHFVPLHSSPAGRRYGDVSGSLPITEDLSTRLLRLPFYFELTEAEQDEVAEHITHFLEG
jgi:dTDP-4-amino-4,6-dideoxygalactose transaminase